MDFSSQLPKPPRLHSCRCPELVPFSTDQVPCWFGLEWTFKGHLQSNPLAMGRDIFHCIRWLKAPSHLAFKHFHMWGIHNVSGQPAPVSQHFHCKKSHSYAKSKPTHFSQKILPCALSLQALAKSPLYVPQYGDP